MRVGLVTDCYHPTKNGVTGVVSLLAAGLEARGHRVVLVAPRAPRRGRPARPGRARPSGHERSAGRGTADADGGFRPVDVARPAVPVRPSIELRFAPSSARSFEHLIARERLEVVHTHTEGPLGLAARRAALAHGRPLVHTLHTFYEHYLHYLPAARLTPRLAERLLRRSLRRFLAPYDRVVAPSAAALGQAATLAPTVPAVLVPNGVDGVDGPGPEPSPRRDRSPATGAAAAGDRPPATLLYVGRLAPEKRSVQLFDALAAHLETRDDVRAVLVGGGGSLETLRRRASRPGLQHRIVLPGYLPHAEVLGLYLRATVFLTASLSENHPLTLLEAAAAGLPLAVRRDPNLTPLVSDGITGIEADDDRELARRAVELARDPDRCARLGTAARDTARGYSVDTHVERTERLYRDLLHQRTPPAAPYRTTPAAPYRTTPAASYRTTVRSRR
jgi:1,2-diacylglycerol 3-alpha-glucosyltransferase